MSMRKSDLRLPMRTPAYVSREVGAAEICVSPGTWDDWVEKGILPKPVSGPPGSTPRWRWSDVDARLAGRPAAGEPDAMDGAADPFVTAARRLRHAGKKARGQRPAAA